MNHKAKGSEGPIGNGFCGFSGRPLLLSVSESEVRRKKHIPRSFYDKGKELLEQAEKTSHLGVRRYALSAARRYYEADVKSSEPFAETLPFTLISWIVIFVSTVFAFRELPLFEAAGVLIGSFLVLSFVVGTALRVAGYISESSLMSIFKAGVWKLLLLRKSLGI